MEITIRRVIDMISHRITYSSVPIDLLMILKALSSSSVMYLVTINQ